MKKFFTFISAIMMAMMFTACDGDQMIGMTLEGGWEGNMYVQSEWQGHIYKAAETEIVFEQNPFRLTKGYGTWVDYYSNAPWDYVANHIRWEVKDRVISIYFVEDDEWVDIYDFNLYNNRFVGYIETSNHRRIKFDLVKIYDYDYTDYGYGYDYWGYDYYPYYAKAAGSAQAPMAPATPGQTERPKRMFVAD